MPQDYFITASNSTYHIYDLGPCTRTLFYLMTLELLIEIGLEKSIGLFYLSDLSEPPLSTVHYKERQKHSLYTVHSKINTFKHLLHQINLLK